MSADMIAICVQGPAADRARSTVKPAASFVLPVHVRLIWVVETPNAVRLAGAMGAPRLWADVAISWLQRHRGTENIESKNRIPLMVFFIADLIFSL